MNKQCAKCMQIKEHSQYYKGNGSDGLHYWCKQCIKVANAGNYLKTKSIVQNRSRHRRKEKAEEIRAYSRAYKKQHPEIVAANDAKRRARKIHANVAWANTFYINEIYALAKYRTKLHGFAWHVDHIVPLVSDVVCGLHCEFNLQVIPASVNLSKGNNYVW